MAKVKYVSPRDFVSPGPLEIDSLHTLEDLRRACARQRLRDKLTIRCQSCHATTRHGIHCDECSALLPNAPAPTGGPLPRPWCPEGD